jgi:hypothetical protein
MLPQRAAMHEGYQCSTRAPMIEGNGIVDIAPDAIHAIEVLHDPVIRNPLDQEGGLALRRQVCHSLFRTWQVIKSTQTEVDQQIHWTPSSASPIRTSFCTIAATTPRPRD